MAARSASKRMGCAIIVDASAGLSGDMFLAGLVALGADPREIAREVKKLPGLEPFSIATERVKQGGVSALRATVRSSKKARERDLSSILDMVKASRLDARVKELAAKTFRILGAAEGKIHGVKPEKVHFHEVGAVDSIVDIVGCIVALSMLGFPRLFHRPFNLGSGFVSTSHGRLPVPAPATIEILRGRAVRLGNEEGEVVTPTGAALMKSLAGELPDRCVFVPRQVVYATGTREKPAPGMLRLIVTTGDLSAREVAVLCTTIDNMNPELYGHVQEQLFASGALEVYLTQLIMKKGRPGTLLTVLCEPDATDRLLDIVFRETTTIGARVAYEERAELERWTEGVETSFGKIQVKHARLRDGTVKTAPEYEACKAAARKHVAPIADVYDAVRSSVSKKKK